MAAGAALGPMQSAGRTREPRWAKRTTTGTPHPEAGVHRGRTKEPDDGNSKGSGQVERPGIATDYYRTPARRDGQSPKARVCCGFRAGTGLQDHRFLGFAGACQYGASASRPHPPGLGELPEGLDGPTLRPVTATDRHPQNRRLGAYRHGGAGQAGAAVSRVPRPNCLHAKLTEGPSSRLEVPLWPGPTRCKSLRSPDYVAGPIRTENQETSAKSLFVDPDSGCIRPVCDCPNCGA